MRLIPFLMACVAVLMQSALAAGPAKPVPAAAAAPHVSTVNTRNGDSYQGEIKFTDAGLVITPNAGKSRGKAITIDPANLKDLIVTDAPIANTLNEELPGGWRTTDLGQPALQTSAVFEKEEFTVKAAGSQLGGTGDSGGAVLINVGTQAELIARVSSLPVSDSTAKAGLACRKDSSEDARGAMLIVQAGGGSQFIARKKDKEAATVTDGPPMKSPCYLKLVRKDDQIIGSCSADGKNWAQVGAVKVELDAPATASQPAVPPPPAPRAGALVKIPVPQTLNVMGLIACSGKPFEPTNAVFDHVHLQTAGLRAEYFGDAKFGSLAFTRVDPSIDFNWRYGKPGPDPVTMIENLSVRWTGLVNVKEAGDYQFHITTNGSFRVWMNGSILTERAWQLPPTFEGGRPGAKIALKPGVPAMIRIDYIDTGHSGVVLKYSHNGANIGIVAPEAFTFAFDSTDKQWVPATRPGGPTATTGPATPAAVDLAIQPTVRGLQTRAGSFLAGNTAGYDAKTDLFRFRYKGSVELDISPDKTSRVIFKPVIKEMLTKLPEHSMGVLLNRGDFVEGDFSAYEGQKIKISSVLFGSVLFQAGEDAAILQLHDPELQKPAFVVRTIAGSVFMAQAIAFNKGGLTVTDPVAGVVRIEQAELVDVRAP